MAFPCGLEAEPSAEYRGGPGEPTGDEYPLDPQQYALTGRSDCYAHDMKSSSGSLPPSRTSLVGRERELAALDPIVEANRAVTLLGPPGVGKTRLAVEHLRRRAATG